LAAQCNFYKAIVQNDNMALHNWIMPVHTVRLII